MKLEPNYPDAWRDLRKRRLIFWALLLSFLPGCGALFIAIGLPLSMFTGINDNYFFFAIFVSWFLALAIAGFRYQVFPCPRCHRPFAAEQWYRNIFRSECNHCGLPRWENSSGQ
jgi:hypothetical protein